MSHSFGISQSALSVYRNCAFAYLCYKQKKEALMFSQDILDSGKLVHESISNYYEYHFLGKANYEDILATTYHILRNMWDTMLPPEELYKAYVCLQNHAIFESKNIIGTKPLTEVKLSTDVYYGVIDYINLVDNKAVDWKTNKLPIITYDYKVQAYIYKVLFEDNFKQQLRAFDFFFLYPNQIRTIYFDSKDMQNIIDEVNQTTESVKKSIQNNDFPKQPRTEKGCNNCSYRLYCKY